MENKPQLPARAGLDIGALAAAFNNTTTSYKFLWISAILDLLEKSSAPLPMDDIILNMLNTARPLIEKYRLRFGKDDRMAELLIAQAGAGGNLPAPVRRRILRFVPYRFIMPFFIQDGLSKLSPEQQNREIKKNADLRFGGSNPALYKLVGEGTDIKAVEIAPAWRAYLLENIAIVRGWVGCHWMLFLEGRNLNRPNIARRALGESGRESIAQQRRFWQQVMGKSAAPVKCLYSGAALRGGEFALDHYVPFNFVGHNRLWNLHPVAPRVNSSKSDSLPHDRYFGGFVELQSAVLAMCQQKIVAPQFARFGIVEYGEGLHIDAASETNAAAIKDAYEALMNPLLTVARSYGFSEWEYTE